MSDPLPPMRFEMLPPPAHGAADAVRRGRQLRRNRRRAGAGAAVVAGVLVAGAVAFAGTTQNAATDELVPADRPTGTPGPSVIAPTPASGALAVASASSNQTQPRPSSPASESRPSGATPTTAPQPSAAAGAGGAAAGGSASYRSPDLRRTYTLPEPGSARICSGSTSGAVNGTTSRIPWCMSAAVVGTDAGHDLSITICSGQTEGGPLTFATDQEADLWVRRAGVTRWRWSTGREPRDAPHVLQTEGGACWTWTAPWTDVDNAGRALDSGEYELVVMSRSRELQRAPDATATFRIA